MTTAIPEERLERYITALRDADIYALIPRREDLVRFAEAVIAVANDETDPVYRSGYTTGYMHAGTGVPDTNRRARLLSEISLGGRWKSGDVVAWYERHGLDLSVRTARQDLATLRDSGALAQHDEKGVRYFTASQKGNRT